MKEVELSISRVSESANNMSKLFPKISNYIDDRALEVLDCIERLTRLKLLLEEIDEACEQLSITKNRLFCACMHRLIDLYGGENFGAQSTQESSC